MKTKTLLQIVGFLVFSVSTVTAKIPRTKEEVENASLKSKLKEMVESEGGKLDAPGVPVLRKILTDQQDMLLCGIEDGSKYATLRDLCKKIAVLPERAQLGDALFAFFEKTKPIIEKPDDWNEVLIKGDGGSVGLVADCFLAGYGEEMWVRMLDGLIEEGDVEKARVVLDRARTSGKQAEMSRLIAGKVDAAKSEEMKALFRAFPETDDAKKDDG